MQVQEKFRRRVWQELTRIPYGTTANYEEIARWLSALRRPGRRAGQRRQPALLARALSSCDCERRNAQRLRRRRRAQAPASRTRTRGEVAQVIPQ